MNYALVVMKILISIGTLGLGGAEKQAVWLANQLSKNHKVTLLTYYGGVREKDLNPSVNWETIFEMQNEERHENFDYREFVVEKPAIPPSFTIEGLFHSNVSANPQCDTLTSLSKLTLLEEKVKTTFKNFPLSLKLLRYFYIKCMPLIEMVTPGLHLIFRLPQRVMTKFLGLMRKSIPYLTKSIPYLTLSSLRQHIKNQTYVFVRARRIVKEASPDLIITFLFHDTLNVGLAGLTQVKRPKLIVGRRSPIGYGDDSRSYFHLLVLRIIYRYADLAVSNSSGNLEAALRDGLGKNQVKIVHNFVQANNSKLRPNDSHETHLICVSNFFEYKNHLNLIKALGEIKNQFTFRLTFLGEGPLLSEMISLAKSLNLTADFFSHEDQAKISEFKVDFLLLPSFFEGSSNALLESLAEGIPAIVTNVGLVPELKEMGAPLIVSNGTDFKSLKIALQDGLNFQHDLKVQARNFKGIIKKEFGEVKVLQDWLQLIEKV
jgi:glycosyltransferase involved in cell wall biosynthesis